MDPNAQNPQGQNPMGMPSVDPGMGQPVVPVTNPVVPPTTPVVDPMTTPVVDPMVVPSPVEPVTPVVPTDTGMPGVGTDMGGGQTPPVTPAV